MRPQKRRWSPEEEAIIRQHYQHGTHATQAALEAAGYQRTRRGIAQKARQMGVTSMWTDTEERILKINYPRRGAKATSERLAEYGYHRSPRAVIEHARKINVRVGEIKGYVQACDVHSDGSQASRTILRDARRDGVLLEVNTGGPPRYLVPESWADEWVAFMERRWEAERLGWLSSSEAAREFGVDRRDLGRVRRLPHRNPALAAALEGVRVRRAGAGVGRLVWHPGDIRTAAVRYRVAVAQRERAA